MSRGFSWERSALLLLALVTLAVQWLTAEALHEKRTRVQSWLTNTPLDRVFPSLRTDLRREVDPARGNLLVARAWLALSFDPGRLNQLPPREAMEAASHLPENVEHALMQAQEVLKARPASGEAAAVVAGLANQSAAWRQQQEIPKGAWERPLDLALKLSPDDPETLLIAGVIAVDHYADLEPGGRHARLRLIRRAMEDPHSFRVLFPRWSEVVETADEWLAPVPRHSWAWRFLAEQARAQQNDRLFCQFYGESEHLLRQELQAQLDEAARWLQGKDPARARSLVLGVLHNLPAEAGHAPLLMRALELLPPGPLPSSLSPLVRRWLDLASWYVVLGRELLPPATVQRLSLVVPAGDLPGLATARLLSGDRLGAEALERRQEALNTEPWADYVLTKAAWLADRGLASQAQVLLELLPPGRRKLASAQSLLSRISGRSPSAEKGLGDDDCSGLGPLPPFCFRVIGNSWLVEVMLPKAASQLHVLWDADNARGVVQILADGQPIACVDSVNAADTKVALDLAPGLHRLELRPLVGNPRPAELWLDPAE